MFNYSIASDFSRTPSPRVKSEGRYSGEALREVLAPMIREAIAQRAKMHIDLDGTAGYGTSFLEEAFGGLVRYDRFSSRDLREFIVFNSKEEDYLVDDINGYWADAEAAANLETREE